MNLLGNKVCHGLNLNFTSRVTDTIVLFKKHCGQQVSAKHRWQKDQKLFLVMHLFHLNLLILNSDWGRHLSPRQQF